MNGDEFLDAVRDDNRTALSRLGSSKALYAETAGEMDAEAVLAAAATAERGAAQTFAGWAHDETNERAREVFEVSASEEADHYETVTGKLAEPHDFGETPALHTYLRELDETVERAGGFVGRTIASEQSKAQLTGFFVGQADPGTAALFRELGEDLDVQRARALSLLEDVCETPADWERARAAADGAIDAAYGEYTDALEELGVNPKPVC